MTVALLLSEARYEGWRSIRITRGVQQAASSFELALTDRWVGGQELLPVIEESRCQVELEGQIIIDGWIGSRNFSLSSTDFTLGVTGKDRVGALVENSVLLDRKRWTFRQATIVDICRKLAEPFGIEVRVAPGTTIPKPLPKISISPGEMTFDVMQRVAQTSGLLLISDGSGALLLTQSGTERAEALIEGQNLFAFSGSYSAEERYYRYVVLSQTQPKKKEATPVTRSRAEAIDENVARDNRVKVITPPQGINNEYAGQRADWEARIAAASSETLTATVRGWTQTNGELWPINALVSVQSPRARVDGEMLISQATYTIDDGGAVTQLSLVRPDAFTPEPRARKVKKAGTKWKKVPVADPT